MNLGLMGKILYDDYHSMSTVSCTASFALLVLMKIYNSLCVARVSIKQDEMRSAFLKEFTSFNVLDVDYVKKKYGTESRSESGVALEDVSVEIPESKP